MSKTRRIEITIETQEITRVRQNLRPDVARAETPGEPKAADDLINAVPCGVATELRLDDILHAVAAAK